MGNKAVTNVFPAYDLCCQRLRAEDLRTVQERFQSLSLFDIKALTLDQFYEGTKPSLNTEYYRKYVFPRLFSVLDVKKDQMLDMEEFVSAATLFKLGTIEDKIKVLFVMYEGGKTGSLTRDHLRQLIIDATICAQRENVDLESLDKWIESMRNLSEVMVDAAFMQFSCQTNKMDLQDFTSFVKVEGTIYEYLSWMSTIFVKK